MKTPREMRRAIARDVLLQLNERKLKAIKGDYLGASPLVNADNGVNAQPLLLAPRRKRCEVCALGAGIVSLIRLENEFLVGDRVEPRRMLTKYFGLRQLDMLEKLFEGWDWPKALGNVSLPERLHFLWGYVAKHPDFEPDVLRAAAIRFGRRK